MVNYGYESEYETRQERSIPVQGRISVVDLADIVVHMEGFFGLRCNTMSMLLNTSIAYLVMILKKNGHLEDISHRNVSEAMSTLTRRGLLKGRMLDRARAKLNNAMAFDNLRDEGINPKDFVPKQYNTVHNSQSVNPVMFEDGEAERLAKKAQEALFDPKIAEEQMYQKKKLIKQCRMFKERHGHYPEEFEEMMKREDELEEKDKRIVNLGERPGDSIEHLKRKPTKRETETYRSKTKAEIEADFKRIEEKDKRLMDALDECPMPSPTEDNEDVPFSVG